MFSFGSKLLVFSVLWGGGVAALLTNKLINYSPNAVVLGTYEDYMSPDMISLIGDKYEIKLDYFQHDQVVKDRFKENVYGMAVVSTSILEELIHEDLVSPVDWSEINLTDNNTTVSTSDNAKNLFTDVVKNITETSKQSTKNKKLLDYGVPYFMQKLSFCYVGDEIEELKKNNSSKSWKEIALTISKEKRFKSVKGSPKLGLIEDPRSILSLSRFIGEEKSVNPTKQYENVEEIYSEYQKLHKYLNKENMGENFLYLDSNSPHLVDSLVVGDINGAIMYNADCLYASYGGNVGEDSAPEQLHVVDISNDIFFLDFLVISKNLNKKQKKQVYSFYKDILFNGHKEEKSKLLEKEDEEYKWWLTKNFDHVRYSPVIKKLEDALEDCTYFDDDSSKKDLRKKTVKVKFNNSQQSTNDNITNHYESYFSSKVKSDMLVAFAKFKEQL